MVQDKHEMGGTAQILVYHLDARRFGMHLSQVLRVIRAVECTALPDGPGIVFGVIDLHGQIVPVLDIRRRFGLPERDIDPGNHFVIATASGRTVALVVDDVEQVVERPVSDIVRAAEVVPGIRSVDGVVQLGDGLTLLHDLDRFLSLDEGQALDRAMPRLPAHGS